MNEGYYKIWTDKTEGVPRMFIKKCPHCQRQLGISLRWILPSGYDNVANPISMYPPNQVGTLDIEITGGKKSE